MRTIILVFTIGAAVLAGELFRDDFSRLPPGLLSQPVGQLNGAIQEYHYLAHRGVQTAPWANAIVHQDAWAVSDEDGHTYVEQHLLTTNDRAGWFLPMFVTGDPAWHSYTFEVEMRPLSFKDMADRNYIPRYDSCCESLG